MKRFLSAISLSALLCSAQLASAQDAPAGPALLVADDVVVTEDEVLIATGAIEVLQGDQHLSATRIVFDGKTDKLQIEGPLRITNGDDMIILGSAAELDEDMRNGLIQGARIVLDQQLQISSTQGRRVNGRYTELARASATSCHVCGKNQTPLWQIRATRAIHDQQERQLYFDNAQLRVVGVPVFYLPRLRLPDPTLKRARGFLIPRIRNSTTLGWGIKAPYFIPIGDHQDLTLTPYVTQKTRTMEFRYRRAFWNGDVSIFGAVSSDDLQPGKMRGYIFTESGFNLPNDFRLEANLRYTTDNSYLNQYSVTARDRLQSDLTLRRVKRDRFFEASLLDFYTQRADENNATQPTVFSDVRYESRHFPKIGGEIRLGAQSHSHRRSATSPTDGTDTDTIPDGRDVLRLSADASWRNRWTVGNGLRLAATGHLWLNSYRTAQDATVDREVTTATPAAALELRYPMMARSAGGRTLLEPIMQLGWTGGSRQRNPNDESTRTEFDEGNLLTLSRFPAPDRRERGMTVATGLRWSHYNDAGWKASFAVGHLWRDNTDADFSPSSGLRSQSSDWLVSGQLIAASGLTLIARGLLDDSAQFSKAEGRAIWSKGRLSLDASYLYMIADATENRSDIQSEWTLSGGYRISKHWYSSFSARYDLGNSHLDNTGFGLRYENECVLIAGSANRTYARAANLAPTTTFDLTVELRGFGNGGSAKEYRRTCSN